MKPHSSDVQAHTAHTDDLDVIPCYCESLELETRVWAFA